MDPLEEFEFKPLTQGLGFHKKNVDLETEAKRAPVGTKARATNSSVGPTPESVEQLIASIPTFDKPAEQARKTLDILNQSPIKPALPREEIPGPAFRSPRFRDLDLANETVKTQNEVVRETPVVPNLGSALSQIGLKQKTENTRTETNNRISSEPLPIVLKEMGFPPLAFFFDALVVVGLNFLFTGVVLAITKADLSQVLESARTDIPTMASLILLVLSVIQLYLILSRSFFGATLGEWAFDLTVGSERQQKKAWYPLAIAWRSFLVMITGFVPLTFLSWILRKDILGFLSGVKRYQKT